jgi:hypothetical protein
MLQLGLPTDVVRHKMKADGLSSDDINNSFGLLAPGTSNENTNQPASKSPALVRTADAGVSRSGARTASVLSATEAKSTVPSHKPAAKESAIPSCLSQQQSFRMSIVQKRLRLSFDELLAYVASAGTHAETKQSPSTTVKVRPVASSATKQNAQNPTMSTALCTWSCLQAPLGPEDVSAISSLVLPPADLRKLALQVERVGEGGVAPVRTTHCVSTLVNLMMESG